MLHSLGRVRRRLLQLIDLVALAVSLPIACLSYSIVPFRVPGPVPPVSQLLPALALGLLFWAAAAWFHQLYAHGVQSTFEERKRALKTLSTVGIGFLVAVYATKEQQAFPRLLMAFYFGTAAALLALDRVGSVLVMRTARRQGIRLRYYAVVGCGELAREIVQTVSSRREWGMNLAGFITDDEEPTFTDCVILGPLSDLGRILEEHVLDEVIFAVPRARLPAIESAILVCEEQGVAVRISLDVLQYGSSKMLLSDLDGLPMLSFTRTPSDEIALAFKRTFDVVVSAAVLVVMAPLLAAVAVAIKLDSPGPIIFRQRRVGLHGRPFHMYKFRSMHVDAEARLESLRAKNEMSGPVFKMTNDPRVTRVGQFIRKTSLDEFPQFLNVLIGDMSVVGPRPPVPAEVRQYKRWQRRRLSVRPGITCTWQISGRNDIDFERWMELDLAYIDHWSLINDIRICLKTIPAVLAARGVH